MPKIGMRILKSSLAVFCCFLMSFIRKDGMPFYSAIAAILCMQPYKENSIKVGKNRIVGTVIGGIFGMFILIIQRNYFTNINSILNYFLISLCIIPLIYITLLIEKTSASYITCVVFLSVTVTHAVDISPYLFAVNRIIDTLIGILISLAINSFHFPRKKNTDILFVSDLDGTLLNSSGKINTYSKVHINNMIKDGALISVATSRTPSTLLEILEDVNINIPVITMNGAALYDLTNHRYIKCHYIDRDAYDEVLSVFKKNELNCFTHTIINDIAHVYYGKFTNKVEEKYYYSKKLLRLKNYVYGEVPEDVDIIYIKAIDKHDIIKKIYNDIIALNCFDKINALYYEDKENPGYYYLEVYSIEASKKNAMLELKKIMKANKTVAFGNNLSDFQMINEADYGYVVNKSVENVKKIADEVLGSNDKDFVVKKMKSIFYNRKFKSKL